MNKKNMQSRREEWKRSMYFWPEGYTSFRHCKVDCVKGGVSSR